MCTAKSCRHKSREVRRFLNTGDAKLTGNMHKHAKRCWSAEVVASVDKAKSVNEVCAMTVKGILDPQLITSTFKPMGKSKVTFSHQQHTRTESRA
jgi:hypothetical protein